VPSGLLSVIFLVTLVFDPFQWCDPISWTFSFNVSYQRRVLYGSISSVLELTPQNPFSVADPYTFLRILFCYIFNQSGGSFPCSYLSHSATLNPPDI
jgi:hypothetical protein